MRKKEYVPIENRKLKMGENMSMISFSDLVKELTGVSFEPVYKNFLLKGKDQNEKSNVERSS